LLTVKPQNSPLFHRQAHKTVPTTPCCEHTASGTITGHQPALGLIDLHSRRLSVFCLYVGFPTWSQWNYMSGSRRVVTINVEFSRRLNSLTKCQQRINILGRALYGRNVNNSNEITSTRSACDRPHNKYSLYFYIGTSCRRELRATTADNGHRLK